MKSLLATMPIALVFSLAAPGQTPADKPTLTVGYVSSQRIFAESTDGKAEVARAQTIQQQKTIELRSKQQALDALRQQIAQAADGTSRAQLQQQEQQLRADLEKATIQAQAEMQLLQRQVQSDVLARVKPVIADLAKGQNVQLVLNSDTSVVWAAPGLDLTTAVIERMNRTTAPKP